MHLLLDVKNKLQEPIIKNLKYYLILCFQQLSNFSLMNVMLQFYILIINLLITATKNNKQNSANMCNR